MKLLQGILIGRAIGLLLAPDKGSPTRAKLSGKLSNFKDDTQDYLSVAADIIKIKPEALQINVKSKVQNVTDKIKSELKDLKETAVSK